MRSEQFASANQGKPPIAATVRPGEFKGEGVVPAKAAGKAAQAAPAPGGNVTPPESKEKQPAGEHPVKPEAAPNAPKVEEKPAVGEKPVKPEGAPKVEEKAVGEKPAKPEAPKVEEKHPAAEKPVKPEAAQKAVEKPPAPERKPGQPERKPAPKECGRPGEPPCQK